MTHRLITVISLVAVLVGCQTAAQKTARQESARVDQEQPFARPVRAAPGAAPAATPTYARMRSSWIGHDVSSGSVIEPQHDLPAIFDARFVIQSAQPMSIADAARTISTTTGLPVRLLPDVFEPGGGAAIAAAAAAGGATGLAQRGTVTLWENGPLRKILDSVAAQTGLEWRYDAGAIEISRYVTATFKLDFAVRPTNTSTRIGAGGGTGGGVGAGATATVGGASGTLDSSTDTASRLDPAASLQERLRAVLTPSGRLAISAGSNTVTVRDVRSAVEAAGRLVREENALLSRSIEIEIEFVAVSSRNISEYGVDWTALYTRIQNGVPQWVAGISGPAALVSSSGGSLQFSVPVDSGRSTAGSDVVVRALTELGDTSTVFRRAVTTTHNVSVPLNNVTNQGYISRLTPAPAGGAGLGSGTPGAEQSTITTGFQLTLTPTILSGNRVQVSIALSLSTLDRLENVSLGGGAQIQTPTTTALQFLQSPILRSGEIYATQAYERRRNEGNSRTLDPTAVLGTMAGTQNRETVVMIVRPVLLSSEAVAYRQ
jgi:type IVB pilus formation R64 PilN family outer membrane protein